MLDLYVTQHAETRMRQRGFRNADIDLVLSVGTRIADDAFFVSNHDVMREIERRRREIQQLERLRGSKLVVQGETVITLYHSDKSSNPANARKRRPI